MGVVVALDLLQHLGVHAGVVVRHGRARHVRVAVGAVGQVRVQELGDELPVQDACFGRIVLGGFGGLSQFG